MMSAKRSMKAVFGGATLAGAIVVPAQMADAATVYIPTGHGGCGGIGTQNVNGASNISLTTTSSTSCTSGYVQARCLVDDTYYSDSSTTNSVAYNCIRRNFKFSTHTIRHQGQNHTGQIGP